MCQCIRNKYYFWLFFINFGASIKSNLIKTSLFDFLCPALQFTDKGYLVLDDFITPEEVVELKEAAQKLCQDAAQDDSRMVFTSENRYRDRYFLDSGDKIRYFYEKGALDEQNNLTVPLEIALNKVGHALHTDVPAFEKITFHNRVREACWQLGMKKPAIPQSMYIFKNPGVGGEVVPHQDGTFLYTEPASTIGFWIALDDATPQNGCLQFIPGSHKGGVHRRMVLNPDKESEELIVFDRPAPIYPASNFTSVPVAKGSCVLIHSQVVHRSDPNKSDKSRHAYTFHVIETENCEYSKENWLQAPEGKPFPKLY